MDVNLKAVLFLSQVKGDVQFCLVPRPLPFPGCIALVMSDAIHQRCGKGSSLGMRLCTIMILQSKQTHDHILMQYVAKGMVERGEGGAIVNVSSLSSLCALKEHAVYCKL
jgi:NAD(P)-dependent dehydrogenase (short-subunit alcohol dehydrogenase family)